MKGPGKRFKNKSLDEFEPTSESVTRAYQSTKNLCGELAEGEHLKRGLVMIGDVGTGKTHLMACIWKHLSCLKDRRANLSNYVHGGRQTEDVTANWYFVPDLLGRVRESYDRNTDSSPVKNAKKTSYLFLDDLGTEQNTQHTADIMIRIIDARYRAENPTFATSNQPKEKLIELYGQPMISRLSSQGEFIEMQGPDFRVNGGRDD